MHRLLRLKSLFAMLFANVLLTAGCIATKMQSPLAAYEQSRVYYPSRFPEGDWQPAGLKFEDARFAAADGTQLHGWFVPHNDSRAVVLFAHGNAGNISHRAETLRILNQRHGLSVMAFDYRGYGRSEGDPNEQGLLQDARAARTWLAKRTGVGERDIVLMGRSLGGGVMVDLAAADGARGLVLASTFTSLPDVATEHVKWIPARALMKNRFDSVSKIGRYKGPLLQSHGDADEIVPYKLGQSLFEKAIGPKRFVTILGGTHNSPQSEEYRLALDEFIDRLP